MLQCFAEKKISEKRILEKRISNEGEMVISKWVVENNARSG